MEHVKKMEMSATRWRLPFLGAALALTTWGIVGALPSTNGWTDALFEPDYTILHAPEGSPLAQAGFQPGDSVLSVEGNPVVELGMYSRWPRTLSRAPGESLRLVVDREGTQVSGEVVFRQRPGGNGGIRLVGLLIGLSFLWAGVWVLFVTRSSHALRLSVMGLAAGLALPGPSLGSWNGVRDHLQVAGMVLWTLMMLRFFLFFPKPKPFGTGRMGTAIVYAGWVILLGCLVTELIFHPRFYHTFAPLYGLLMLGYFLLAVVAFMHTVVKTSPEERTENGVAWVVRGIATGVGGLLLLAVIALLPGVSFPGSDWLVLALAAIPVGLALGVRKGVAPRGV